MPITARRISARHSSFRSYEWQRVFSSLLFFLATITTIPLHANGEINELITSSATATPSTIVMDGISYQWGQGENLQLDGFYLDSDEYVPNLKAHSVSVLRRDIPGVATGELCGVFAERQGSAGNDMKPDFSALLDPAGICDMSAMLMSSVINRGTLDTFTNTGANPNNIERIDYHFDSGITAPSDPDYLASAGHIIGEKHGNNHVQIAAILAMDESGRPAQYGPLVSIGRVGMCAAGGICYGQTSHVHDYVFFKSHSLEPLRDLQEAGRSREPVSFAFLSMETLGIPAGSTYYGISVFPHDINATDQNLPDISSFPDDTQEPEIARDDSADIYGGSAFLYIKPSGVITGRVFCQADEGATAPKPNVPISLFRDTTADGVLDELEDELVAEFPGTTMDGRYSFLGLRNGSYFVAVSDRTDGDAASLAVVFNSSPIDDADIVLDEPCLTAGPTAVDDTAVLNNESFKIIEVLVNDRNAEGVADASELRIIRAFNSTRGELEVQDRAVAYTVSQATRALFGTELTQITDTFSYIMEDDQGLTSEATVEVTINVTDEGVDLSCLEQDRTDCFFVETEVEGIGVGRSAPLACLLLLTFVVMRRYALFPTSTGVQS